ncbi:uncharacterized protein LOC114927981 [Nylanderia fulva]|uniref:uncharacterized protein LOC114927981 n=1 Tax=Nylanderia fulva TaxID=613905 RepID=UPI0010FAFB9D|nr:uncharacterized protein LOC114927981 [Nylanderia fulva]
MPHSAKKGGAQGKQGPAGEEQRGRQEDAEEASSDRANRPNKLKLKNLKLAYFKCRRDNNVSGAATSRCAFYNELELLYGCRPTAEASSSNSGIDTASTVNDTASIVNEDSETGDIDNEAINNCNIVEEEKEGDTNEMPKKKRRQCNGRKSYKATLENYTDKWLESQKLMLNTMLERQEKMQKIFIQEEMKKQRDWEKQEMEKERKFQREQMNILMRTFSQSINSLKPQMPVTLTHNYTPLKLIPMAQADPSGNILKKITETIKTTETIGKENLPET